MKTAIIYSGGMRSFDRCWKNHQWMIWRHFPGAKFYCVTEDDEDAQQQRLLTIDKTRSVFFKPVQQPEMIAPPGCPEQWNGPGQPYMHEPYAISVPPQAVLGQLWMLRQAWALYEEANDPADLVIRIRPDLWFHSFEKPHGLRFLGGGTDEMKTMARTPWWGRFGGCNDRFALLGSKAAEAYFTTYDHIPGMIAEGAPLHPETLVYSSMKRAGISICDDMKAEFSTLRKTGEMRPPEITMIDLAHASMR